jgi:hypothetical protein
MSARNAKHQTNSRGIRAAAFVVQHRCGICPHVDYLTVSVSAHRHECFSCGETFVDPKRVKKYFGKGPR